VKVNEDSSLQRRRENRTRIDVMTCILRKSQIPTRKTQIMYSCGLSSKQAAYLPGVLLFNDLIEKDGESRIHQTTKKGCEFLSYYNRLSQLLQTEEMETPRSRSETIVVGSIFRNRYSAKQK
jgi:predicted transcriptional regulator